MQLSKNISIHILLSLFLSVTLLSGCKKKPTVIPEEEVQACIQPPANLPSAWGANVHPNCFKNIDRLGKWIGGTTVLSATDDPSPYFQSVKANSIGNNLKGTNLYIVAHGWAPGLRAQVNKAKGDLQWWSTNATDASGQWESNWAWTGATGSSSTKLPISPTGLLQQIIAYEKAKNDGRETVALAYSWIDDSATTPIDWENDDTWTVAYLSEAYTNLNGLRLANAIQEVTTNGFFDNPSNKLHIMGHSHGTKVATVATLELQKKNLSVEHLTVFDSPEATFSQDINSANLLGYYFNQMTIGSRNMHIKKGLTFVDSYISYFGSGYKGPVGSPINNIAQVGLDSYEIFSLKDIGGRHSYSASYYANAAAGAKAYNEDPKGLDWPPVAPKSTSDWYQSFSSSPTQQQQWKLWEGSVYENDFDTFLYTNPSISIEKVASTGNVTGSANTTLIMASSIGKPINAAYTGKFRADLTGLYGISFDMKWENAQKGDYIVVTVTPPSYIELTPQEITLIFDHSAQMGDTWHPISFNTYSNPLLRDHTQFVIRYYPNPSVANHQGVAFFKNFGYVKEVEQ